MPRGQAKDYAALDLEDLAGSKLVTDPNEIKKLAPPKRGYKAAEPSPLLAKLIEYSTELYDKYVDLGKPSEFEKGPMRKIPVAPDKVESMKFLIKKSVEYVAKAKDVKLGTPEFGSGDAKTSDGRVVISYRVTDPRRTTKPKAE